MKTYRTPLFALLAAGILAVGALAIPVAAEEDPDDRSSSDSHSKSPREQREAAKHRAEQEREAAKEHAEARREAAKERAEAQREAAKERYEDRCVEDADELNESEQDRCMKFKKFGERAHKARREAHALLGAIDAIERRMGRLEAREIALEQKLASGNFSGNETNASIQMKIEKIDEHQEKLAERLAHLRERLEALHARWAEVRDHVEERRHHGSDDEDDDSDDDSSSSGSSSSSATETSSVTSTSTAPA